MRINNNWESKAIKPEEPINTASAFAQWVFEQSIGGRLLLSFQLELHLGYSNQG